MNQMQILFFPLFCRTAVPQTTWTLSVPCRKKPDEQQNLTQSGVRHDARASLHKQIWMTLRHPTFPQSRSPFFSNQKGPCSHNLVQRQHQRLQETRRVSQPMCALLATAELTEPVVCRTVVFFLREAGWRDVRVGRVREAGVWVVWCVVVGVVARDEG